MRKELTEMEKHNVLRLSNKKSNRITRECLETALLRLLTEKELGKISITELVRVAGVSRTAFYTNYSSKEDILSYWMAQLGDDLVAFLWPYVEAGELTEMFRQLFMRVIEDRHQLSIVFQVGLQYKLSAAMETAVLKKNPGCSDKDRYVITGYCGLVNNVLMEWFHNDMRESVEEMAALCSALIAPPYDLQS